MQIKTTLSYTAQPSLRQNAEGQTLGAAVGRGAPQHPSGGLDQAAPRQGLGKYVCPQCCAVNVQMFDKWLLGVRGKTWSVVSPVSFHAQTLPPRAISNYQHDLTEHRAGKRCAEVVSGAVRDNLRTSLSHARREDHGKRSDAVGLIYYTNTCMYVCTFIHVHACMFICAISQL